MRPDAGRFYSSSGNGATALAEHFDEQRDGQPDDVEEASLDVRHECRSRLLDGVSAGAPAPLAPRHVLVDRLGAQRPEAHGRARVPGSLAEIALRFTISHPAVSTVIPGAKTPEQAQANAAAADLPMLPNSTMDRIAALYREKAAPLVHQRW